MKTGLVLSGGGARGIAHLGIIQALNEEGVKFDFISGTSAGAIIGALYSAGMSIEEILKVITDLKTFQLLKPAFTWNGILKMEVVDKFLQKYLPVDDFSSLKIPMYIAATNLRTGTSDIFYKGKLRSAICASSCIPVLFDPVEYNGELYIDGGVLNNLPVNAIRNKCDIIIGCHSNPVDVNFKPKNARFVMERALMMAITKNAYQQKEDCDIFIEPKGLEPFKVMDLNKAREIYEIGYNHTRKAIKNDNILDSLK